MEKQRAMRWQSVRGCATQLLAWNHLWVATSSRQIRLSLLSFFSLALSLPGLSPSLSLCYCNFNFNFWTEQSEKRGEMGKVLIGWTVVPSSSSRNKSGFCLLMRKGRQLRLCHRDLIMMMTTPESSLRSNSRSPLSIKNRMVNPPTYSSRIATDIPLLESPGASFDQYLEDKPRVFKAIFPDKRRAHRLNEDVWRIQMLPIQFLFLSVWPVIDMRLRCKSGGTGYPPGVPQHVTKLIELDIIRWELQGLDDILKPAEFTLAVKGTMYPDRQGTQTRLKGQLKMSVSFVLPPVLALVPEDVRQSVAQSVRPSR
ncbi:uncharacterized protein LOC127803367 isoform X2 [Diospyros lotus]|uniref:uncharacterized protein LOC127803367 isoform X2 n=1 Tax=Diospyros lotus TaxID=55363 RepID=UPI002255496D|nr:uncharacterized protein LOC127803367 isoform X2 [Diospyros lotus]